MVDKVVLAYSGGLDTSVAIKWLEEKYSLKVVAVTVDVGEEKDLDFIREKALKVGALECYVVDAKREFVSDYVLKALKANALYEWKYPLSAALSRPLIAKKLVEVAESEGAVAVAHGCTGKGNDQVRFDVSFMALNPRLKIIAPVREWPMSRNEEIEYAASHGIPVPVGQDNPYSIDQNLWGRSIECGIMEDPWAEPPDDAFIWAKPLSETPDEPGYIEIDFERGVPAGMNGRRIDPVEFLSYLNQFAGMHGFGKIDTVENRLVGIKSREVYEAPAALVLIKAHQELESMVLPREVLHFKTLVDQKYAELAYNGLWYSPLREALDAFIDKTQERVTGTVRMKLFKGSCQVVGRRSPNSLYDYALATYDPSDTFDYASAEGFIRLWGLPTKLWGLSGK